MSEPLSGMIEALGLEVAAIRKKGGGSTMELRAGERVGEADGRWLYKFIVPGDTNLRDESPVQVEVEGRQVAGILVSVRDGVLIVAIDADLGPKIPLARLKTDESFLIERLKKRLEEIDAGTVGFNTASAARSLGLAPARSADAEPDARALGSDAVLNEHQEDAIRRAFGSEATFVWGPPGTGKTTTLARVVAAHYYAGRSVLLVSNTNIAVDTALEKIAEQLRAELDFQQGLVIRHGPIVKEELRDRYADYVSIDAIVARVGAKLEMERQSLLTSMEPLEAQSQWLRKGLEAQRERKARLDALELQGGELRSREGELRGAVASRARLVQQLEKLQADLTRAQASSALGRFLAGLNPEKLRVAIGDAHRRIHVSDTDIVMIQQSLKAIQAQITSARQALVEIEERLKTIPSVKEIERQQEEISSKLAEGRKRLSEISAELSKLQAEILKRCKILATTVYRTYLGKEALRQFDVVVVDEASMLMPPLVYHAAGLAKQAVVVAGDFRQLPPIVASDDPLAGHWLKRDAFEVAGIPDALASGAEPDSLVHLDTQYRMRSPICDVINELFYSDHPLETHHTADERGSDSPFGEAALAYIDTSDYHPWAAFKQGTYSRYNLLHALLVRSLVSSLAEAGFLQDGVCRGLTCGAVSPFSAQSRLIQSMLEDQLGRAAAGVAATIHRYQGNEKRVMIIDLSDSSGAPLSRFMKAAQMSDAGTRMLNVAVSRAMSQVVLVANFDFLRRQAPRHAKVRALLDQFMSSGERLDVSDFVPFAEQDWLDGSAHTHGKPVRLPDEGAAIFTEGDFYAAFPQDLRDARSAITLFSPFLTGPGTARWADLLRAAIARRVLVHIFTKPPKESGGAAPEECWETIKQLRALGAVVDLRSKMHEKIAMIDGRILWHGSLNILSHNDTQEIMTRIVSPDACATLARLITSSRADEEREGAVPPNPPCPKCAGPMAQFTGKNGIWFECEKRSCGAKLDPRGGSVRGPNPKRPRQRGGSGPISAGTRPCPRPGCNGKLRAIKGRFGLFYGCTNYPDCDHKENPRRKRGESTGFEDVV